MVMIMWDMYETFQEWIRKPIPSYPFPEIKNEKQILEKKEKIVPLTMYVKSNPMYYNQGILGALPLCYARETVAGKLAMINEMLTSIDLELLILDGYRPIEVQQSLWDEYYERIQKENPKASQEEKERLTSHFVSKPSYDEDHPSLHNTGGAIDVTLCSKGTENVLKLGTEFDDFSEKAWTAYYETHYREEPDGEEVRDNRRLLYWLMLDVGFTNLPSEWWHYDYGDKFWAYYKNQNPIYKGLLKHPFSGMFKN
jgi:D-alanyl-D-alanine dipeptidase